MKTLLSLFDYSGQWSQPFEDAGWNVYRWDIKLDEFMDINLIEDAETALDLFADVDGIMAACPCTDFTVSGAQYWPAKDADGRTEFSKELVRQTLRLVDLFNPTDPDYDGTFFWALENPVGRLNKLFPELGTPLYFNPHDFALWNDLSADDIARLNQIRLKNGVEVTHEEAMHIVHCNAYTKRTGLWGDFNRDLKRKPIEPVRACAQGSVTQRAGGENGKTKEFRSNTPMGFAKAFFEANKNYRNQEDLVLF